jgi:PGF-pre-PGF domain-containing protein
MMKGLMKWTFLILLFIVCIQAVSATISVSSITVDPTGSLTPNTPMTASFRIGANDFPSSGEVRLFTDINNPTWTYTVIVNGIENLRPVVGEKTLVLSGFELSYKASDEVSVRVTLEGTTPLVSPTSDQVLFQISEVDSNGHTTTVHTEYYHQFVSSVSVVRTIQTGIDPGEQFTITLIPKSDLDTSSGWMVWENIPFGFTFIGSNAYAFRQIGDRDYHLIQDNATPLTYTLKAPAKPGLFTFGGIAYDSTKNNHIPVVGDSTITIGSIIQNYRNATTGFVEQADVARAKDDYRQHKITIDDLFAVLQTFFLGGFISVSQVPKVVDLMNGDSTDDPNIAKSATIAADRGEPISLTFAYGPITDLILITKDDIPKFSVVSEKITNLPDGVAPPNGTNYVFLRIEAPNTPTTSLSQVTMYFNVPLAWINSHLVKTGDIVLMRYHDGVWKTLPTEFLDSGPSYAHFRSVSPGLSYFAISSINPVLAVNQSLKENQSSIHPIQSSSQSQAQGPPSPKTPVATSPMKNVTPWPTGTSTNKSTPIGVEVGILALFAAGILVLRRTK